MADYCGRSDKAERWRERGCVIIPRRRRRNLGLRARRAGITRITHLLALCVYESHRCSRSSLECCKIYRPNKLFGPTRAEGGGDWTAFHYDLIKRRARRRCDAKCFFFILLYGGGVDHKRVMRRVYLCVFDCLSVVMMGFTSDRYQKGNGARV